MRHFHEPAGSDDFNDPGGWDKGCYKSHPVDSMEPLSDERNGYRAAAICHMRLMWAVDDFVSTAAGARLAVNAVGITLGWPSTRGWTVPAIAAQIGCSPATISRACARFREISGLPAAGFQYDGPGAGFNNSEAPAVRS